MRIAAADILDRARDDRVELHRLHRQRRVLVTGEVDEVGHKGRQPLDLAHEVAEQVAAVGLVGRLSPGEELEVRSQAREGRAQLVGRVRDELAL